MPTRLSNDAIIAVAECHRFIARVEALEEELANSDYCGTHPAKIGAVRRASMDLTRALAVVRRAGFTRYTKWEGNG